MRNNARTTAKALLIAAGTAGFVSLSSGFAVADTLGDVTGAPETDALGQLPAVDSTIPAPAPTLPSADLPEVAVPEIDADSYLMAAQGSIVLVDFVAQQARGDVESGAAEAGSVADRTASGVVTDLDGVDRLAGGVTDGTDDAVEHIDVPATDAVDTEVLPEAPAVGGVEETVEGLSVADDLSEPEVIDEPLPTDELPTKDLDTDVVDTDLAGDSTDDLTGGLL